jgi:hypothetical protein
MRVWGGVGGWVGGVSANEYSCALGAQINFGNLTPYLTYVIVRTANKGRVRIQYKCRVPRNEIVKPSYFQNRIIMFYLPIPTLIYL